MRIEDRRQALFYAPSMLDGYLELHTMRSNPLTASWSPAWARSARWAIAVPAFWDGLVAGRSAVALATRYDIAEFPYVIAAEIRDFEPRDHMDAKAARRHGALRADRRRRLGGRCAIAG